jgi:hypothetical protein
MDGGVRLSPSSGYAVFPTGHRALQSDGPVPAYEITPECACIRLEPPYPTSPGSRPDCRVGCLDTRIGQKFNQAVLFGRIEQASMRVVLIDVTVVVRSRHLG